MRCRALAIVRRLRRQTIYRTFNHMHTNIELYIATPKGPFVGTFDVNTKVSEVIEVVRRKLGLAADSSFELWFGETRLHPEERPLISFHLPNPAKLKLVATGSGV